MTEFIYNQIGLDYSRYRQADRRLAGAFAYLINLPEESVIAEIGSGTGNYSLALA